MAETPKTTASVAARLTDEEILDMTDFDLCDAYQDVVVPVLRDYVRMRKLNSELRKCVNDADEIRRLAEDFIPNGNVHCIGPKEEKKVYTALLSYAAMVERCEEKIAEYKSYVDVGIVAENISDLNYILKGVTDERK